MKKLTLVLSTALVAGLGTVARAQVQDVSFTVAPVAGYTHWDSKLNLGDAPLLGRACRLRLWPTLRGAWPIRTQL